MIHDYDLSIEEVEAGVLVVQHYSWLYRKFKANLGYMAPRFKKQKNKSKLSSPTFFWHEKKKLCEPMK